MAKTTKKQTEKPDSQKVKTPFWNLRNKMFFGVLLILFAIVLLLSFISFYLYGTVDQSLPDDFSDRSQKAKNWLGKFGAFLADAFLYKGFGVASFLFARLLFLTGIYFILDLNFSKLKKTWFWDLFVIVVLSVLFGFFNEKLPGLGGAFGYEMNWFLQDYIGKAGTVLLLVLGLLIYLIFKIKVSPDKIKDFIKNKKNQLSKELQETGIENQNSIPTTESLNDETLQENNKQVITKIPVKNDEDLGEITLKVTPEPELKPFDFQKNIEDDEPTISNYSKIDLPVGSEENKKEPIADSEPKKEEFVVEQIEEEEVVVGENLATKLVDDF